MRRAGLVRRLARRLPRALKDLRGRLMLSQVCETLGAEEAACPACDGSGWLDRQALQTCPLCCGFKEVPRPVAEWFVARWSSEVPEAGRSCGAVDVERRERPRGPLPEADGPSRRRGERLGRIAERPLKLHLSREQLRAAE